MEPSTISAEGVEVVNVKSDENESHSLNESNRPDSSNEKTSFKRKEIPSGKTSESDNDNPILCLKRQKALLDKKVNNLIYYFEFHQVHIASASVILTDFDVYMNSFQIILPICDNMVKLSMLMQ